MTNTDHHPDPTRLAAFLDGNLSEGERSAVESHVESCDQCCDALARLPMDPLSERLREVDTNADEWSVVTEPGLPKRKRVAEQEVPSALEEHPRYRILEPLGKGGMGVVYKAQHRMMDRIVALKVIDGGLIDNPQMIERFRTEVKAAAMLNHANIVRAYDAEQAGDLHFLVMEYVDGISLAELINRKGPLPIDQALGVTRKVAHGLHHAFQQGMVHRDIKPQNIMITRTGKVRILDFGLARFARERDSSAVPHGDADQPDSAALTLAGSILGTPDYIAPEQITDARTADTRADIYSLGCTCYFLLTGQPPFPDGTAMEKVLSHRDGAAGRVDEIRGEIPADVSDFVARMMSRNPAERFQKPTELIDAIDGILNSLPETPDQKTQVTQELRETVTVSTPAEGESTPQPVLESGDVAAAATIASRRKRARGSNSSTNLIPMIVVLVAFIAILIPSLSYYFSQTGNGDPDLVDDGGGSDPADVSQGDTGRSQVGRESEVPGNWVDLIASVDVEQNAYPGLWHRQQNELSVSAAKSARIAVTFDVPREYDFEVTFTRHEGQHSVALIFVSGSGQATFEVDAWGQQLAGIQRIDGQTFELAESGNPTRTADFRLSNDKPHTMLLRVRRNGVQALLDDIPLATYFGDGSNLTTIPQWALQNHSASLGIGAYESPTTFHRIRVRPIRQ